MVRHPNTRIAVAYSPLIRLPRERLHPHVAVFAVPFGPSRAS